MKTLLLALWVSVALLSGCAVGITRTGYALPPGRASKDLPLLPMVIQANVRYNTNDVQVLGSIHAYDNGFSTDCDEATVLETFCREGSMLGADVVDITEEEQPNPWTSSCYRAKATFLRYQDRDQAKGLVSDARYAPSAIVARAAAATRRNNIVLGSYAAGGTLGGIIATTATLPANQPKATNSVPAPAAKQP